MALFDWFSSTNKTGARFLKKQVQQAQDRRAQSMDRMQALQDLRSAISEAVQGLLHRFDYHYDKSIEDEQEKQWVHETLVALGPGILPELQTYMLQAHSLSWPLKVLGEIAPPATSLQEVLEALCKKHDPSYARDPSPKIQLIAFLGEQKGNAALAEWLLTYLTDRDESVRFAAVEALLLQADPTVGMPGLKKHLASGTEDSRRIQMRVQEGLSGA